jgi:pimeloyl-ACP methyl ester carboxylesterase
VGADRAVGGSRAAEVQALSRLGFDEIAAAVGGIEQLHRTIAARAFGPQGLGARPAQVAHDAISGAVYTGLRGAARLAGRGAGTALAARQTPDLPALSETPAGSMALAVLNGLVGDSLERRQIELHQPMGIRVGGEIVPPTRESLAAAFPDATPRLVVFVHGLMETEHTWRIGWRRHGGTYGSRLRHDLGCTPIYVRYNTGLHISENGRSLAELLAEAVEEWPVAVEEIAIVGHSMGGLVTRSACHVANEEEASWVSRVRHVVSLGTPHTGAPLAQAVHYASAALWKVPETRPLAGFLRRRSAGIRDLRHGSLVDEDWRDRDPDALRRVACREVPLLEGATHCFVAATVTRSPHHPIGRLVGDTLVLPPSASGRSRTRRIPFREEHGAHLGGTHHIALLNHPEVYELLRAWLAQAPSGEPVLWGHQGACSSGLIGAAVGPGHP